MTTAVPEAAIMGDVMARQGMSRDAIAANLFEGHYPRLAGWCRRLVDDDGTAHEIASEAFTRLLTKLSKVDDPVGYLYVIAANLVRDHWRKVERERRALQREAAQPIDTERVPGSGIEIRSLIDALPDRLRVTVLLHYFADYPIREISRLTGRPEGSIKSDLHHARKALRQALESSEAPR